MNKDKLIAYGIIASVVLSILTSFASVQYQDALYNIAGFGLIIFGIWSAIKLLKKQ